LGVAVVAAVSYFWGTAGQEPEIYYAAAVRSMSASWHNFVFAAFDPAGTITVDKLPGALWLQALSVRAFGVHLWALNLPQAIEGVLTVLVLYRAIRRLSGPLAGLVAAAVLAASPATVGLNRGNVSDSLMVLLLVCAADATAAAIRTGRFGSLMVAGVWVGLAFQAKMLQAWLVVPALLLAWFLAGRGSRTWRVSAAIAMIAVTAVVSLSWMLVISVVPHADRPYVDGSTHDSIFQQVFEYNGFSRVDLSPAPTAGDQGTLVGPQGTNPLPAIVAEFRLDPASRADRVVAGRGGRAIGWLLPLALAGLIMGLRRRKSRPAAALWGVWLALDAGAFLTIDTLNAYYLAALAPPIAALTGILVAAATRKRARSSTAWRRAGLGLTAATLAYSVWLLSPAPIEIRVGALAGSAVCCAIALLRPRRAVATLLAAVLIAPVAASIALVVDHAGPFVTPFEPASRRNPTQAGVARANQVAAREMKSITAANVGARYPAAIYSSLLAAPLIYVSGQEILPIGGFSGRVPSPTLAQLRSDIDNGELRTVFILRIADPRMQFVQNTCQSISPANPAVIAGYYCPSH
jgi:4-amino-4-deoxy-L-arabinose transferase-like glycosyltransferase